LSRPHPAEHTADFEEPEEQPAQQIMMVKTEHINPSDDEVGSSATKPNLPAEIDQFDADDTFNKSLEIVKAEHIEPSVEVGSSATKPNLPAVPLLPAAEIDQLDAEIFNKSSEINQNWISSSNAITVPFLAASATDHEFKHLTTYLMGEIWQMIIMPSCIIVLFGFFYFQLYYLDCLHHKTPIDESEIRKLTASVIETNRRIHVMNPPTLTDDYESCQKFADVYTVAYGDQMDMYEKLVAADFYFDGKFLIVLAIFEAVICNNNRPRVC
jgi:hypothetical protein